MNQWTRSTNTQPTRPKQQQFAPKRRFGDPWLSFKRMHEFSGFAVE